MFHETPKSSMEQSFKAGYMIKLDKTFEFHETKFHRVVWALIFESPALCSDVNTITSVLSAFCFSMLACI